MKAETTIALIKEMEKDKRLFSKNIFSVSISVFVLSVILFVSILVKLFEKNLNQEINWTSESLLIISLTIMFTAYSFIIHHRMNKKTTLIIEALLENKNFSNEK